MSFESGAAIAISLFALLLSISAEHRARKADRRAEKIELRQDAEHQRELVRFEVETIKPIPGQEIEVALINTGTKKAQLVQVDPASVTDFAIHSFMSFAVDPGARFTFRYEQPRHGRMKTVAVVWRSPGVGRQVLSLPDHSDTSPD